MASLMSFYDQPDHLLLTCLTSSNALQYSVLPARHSSFLCACVTQHVVYWLSTSYDKPGVALPQKFQPDAVERDLQEATGPLAASVTNRGRKEAHATVGPCVRLVRCLFSSCRVGLRHAAFCSKHCYPCAFLSLWTAFLVTAGSCICNHDVPSLPQGRLAQGCPQCRNR